MTQISLKKTYSGKVRDLYEIDEKTMLIVATDRLSAFDVILPEPIPGKGEILTQISNFWFAKLAHIMPNHFTGQSVYDVLLESEARAVEKRAVVAKRLTPVKIEAIVRGYLAGSGWKEYRKTGTVCGIKLPEGLHEAEKLPQVLFTPSTKAEMGGHDENISFAECERLIGAELAARCATKPSPSTPKRRLRRDARHHYLRHQIRIRPRRQRHPHPDGRSAHPRFQPLLAARPIPRRHQPALLRQTVRARLAGTKRLEQTASRPASARRNHRENRRQIPRSPAPAHRIKP